ncbi:MAG: AAA family ATPase [Planctomycetes bacterium]|nr:AAA family ATPase [Planctomycetota bacterium]
MGSPITKLTIKGYKSIRSLEDFELRPLNILIGANGAGKSNFISFLRLVRALYGTRLQQFVAEGGGADIHLFLGPRVTREIVGSLYFGPHHYGFTLVPTATNALVVEYETFDKPSIPAGVDVYHSQGEAIAGAIGDHDDPKLRDVHHSVRESLARAIRDDDDPKLRQAVRSINELLSRNVTTWSAFHFQDTSGTAGVRRPGTVRDYERLREDAANLAAFLHRLRAESPRAYESIRDAVRGVTPFFDDFKLRPQKSGPDDSILLEWTQKGSDYPFHPSQLSDGTLRFICLATALLQPDPPSTMIIDEPELGLHPYALNVLAGLLKQAATRTQLIVSTQSAALVDYFGPEDIIVVDRAAGASTFRRLERASLEEWLKEYSLGELWAKNVFEGGPAHE